MARATFTGDADTTEYIALHAAERPHAVALIENGRTISYAQFGRDIDKFTTALRDLGLPRGSAVAVGCRRIYIHWLLLLAFERLDVATASFSQREAFETYQELLAGADLVLCDADRPVTAERQFRITPEWVRDVLARECADGAIRERQSPGDIVRILRSSGTTGFAKRIAYTRRMCELRALRDGERYHLRGNPDIC